MAVMASCATAPGWAAPGAPPNGGTISIEQPGTDGQPATVPAGAADAVAAALGERGFTILNDPGHSAYVAELTLDRSDAGTGLAKLKGERGTVTPGGVSGVGGGVILPLSSAKTRTVPLQRVRLDLWIRKRGESAAIWHGAAVTVRAGGTEQGRTEVVASDLSAAMLRFYPNDPPGVVTVP